MAATDAITESSHKEIGAEEWDILQDITEGLESWSRRICELETEYNRTSNLHQNIINSLQRQLLDGLISQQDLKELEYVADLWLKLHLSFKCKVLGCEFSDRDVLTYLLELFSLKQISKAFFIEVALRV